MPENRHQRRQNAGMVISTEQSFKLNQAANQKAPGVSKEEGKNHLEISLIPNRRNSLSKNSQNLEINTITMDGPFKRPVLTGHPVQTPVQNSVHNLVPDLAQNLIPCRRSPSNSPNRSNFSPKLYPLDQTFRSTSWASPDDLTSTKNFTPKLALNSTPQNFTSNQFSNHATLFDPFSKSTSGVISGSISGFDMDNKNENTQRTNVPDNLGWFLQIHLTLDF